MFPLTKKVYGTIALDQAPLSSHGFSLGGKLRSNKQLAASDLYNSEMYVQLKFLIYRDIKRTRFAGHLVDLLCSSDGVLRVKHYTLVGTKEGGTQQKLVERPLLKVVGPGWTQHKTLHFKFTGYVPHDML